MDFWVTNSLNEANTFYIFREGGVEVRVVVIGNTLFTDHSLMDKERAYFKTFILKK